MTESYHQSSLETYRSCPQRYVYSRIRREPPSFKSAAAHAGNTAHAVLAHLHETGEVLDYVNTWNRLENEPDRVWGIKLPVYIEDGKPGLPEYLAKFNAWFTPFLKHPASQPTDIIGIELPFEFEWTTKRAKSPYRFKGTMDLVYREVTDTSTRLVIRDYKTGNSIDSDATFMRKIQAPLYAWGLSSILRHLAGIDIAFEIFSTADLVPYQKKTTRKVPRPNAAWWRWSQERLDPLAFSAGEHRGPGVYRYTLTPEYLRYWRRIILSIAASIRRREFYPSPNMYGCERCEYLEQCNTLWTSASEVSDNTKRQRLQDFGIDTPVSI
tara:strand:- start:4629 stop:5603 length:975 start_codon:yes stop_codon:yes gene_type:complete